jgi:hypothetical protein
MLMVMMMVTLLKLPAYGSEGDRILHDYYVEMAEMTKMDDGCGSEDTTVSGCTISD